MSRDRDSFLGRWSRKKLEGDEPEAIPVEEAAGSAEPVEDLSDEEILAKLDLPDPDELKEGDDFSGFMKAAVPDHLRKRALRKLWLSNPALANLDGLLEYGEDYTDAAMVPEVLNTAYKVGRGFLKDIVEDAEADDSDVDVAESDEDIATDQGSDEPLQIVVEDSPYDAEMTDVAYASEPKRAPRPRMTFTTD